MKHFKTAIMTVFMASLFFSTNSHATKIMIPGFTYQKGSESCDSSVTPSMKLRQESGPASCLGLFPVYLPEGERMITKLSVSYDATNSQCDEIRLVLKERDFETGAIRTIPHGGSTNNYMDLGLDMGQSGTTMVSGINYTYNRDKMLYIDARIDANAGYDRNHCLIRDIRIHSRPN